MVNLIHTLSLERDEPEWLRIKRESAWASYEKTAMPDRTVETWRRTDISGLSLDENIRHALVKAEGDDREEGSSIMKPDDGVMADSIIQKNGVSSPYDDNARTTGTVIYMDMKSALHAVPDLVRRYFLKAENRSKMEKFTLLHNALWEGGVFLYVPLGTYVAMPLCFLHAWNHHTRIASPHTLIVLEEGATAVFYEESRVDGSEHPVVYMGYSEVYLERDSRLTYVTLSNHGDNTYSFPYRNGVIEAGSELNWITIETGGKVSKTFTETVFAGPSSSSRISELVIGSGNQHRDISPVFTHNAPNTKGEILTQGVLYEKSRSVFQGLIDVTGSAEGTDSYLMNRNLIMDDGAEADTIPKLEIKTNDVRVSHGATVGELDQDQLFYLRSRGLSASEAKKEIVRGFVEPVLSAVPLGYPGRRVRETVERILGEH